MPQPEHVIAFPLKDPLQTKEPDIRKYFDKCLEKIGFIPNVLQGYTFKPDRWRAFVTLYHAVMDKKTSKLTPLEREMIAVVVSAANRCFYCLTAHGQAVREMSGDPSLGELLVMNWRVARLSRRQRAMLEVAHRLTVSPAEVGEADRAALRKAGFRDRDIWDVFAVTSFFNMTNRLATATDMMPNEEYHSMSR
jgi:uncharacterized peroxidase-related enzyme